MLRLLAKKDAMMKTIFAILPLCLLGCSQPTPVKLSSQSNVQTVVSQPTFALNQPVIDQTNSLTASEKANLTQKIEKLWYQDKLIQTGVIIIPTTSGQTIFDYCMDKAKQWRLGDKANNNGLLMCIATQDKKMYILTGTGIEKALPDDKIKAIIKNHITPYFPQGKYYQGINAGLDEIIKELAAHRSLIGINATRYVSAQPLPHKQLKISIHARDKDLYLANCNQAIAPALVERDSDSIVWGGVSDACYSPDMVIKKGTSYTFTETINDTNSPLALDKYYQVRILGLHDTLENPNSALPNAEKTSNVFKLLP